MLKKKKKVALLPFQHPLSHIQFPFCSFTSADPGLISSAKEKKRHWNFW